MAGDGLTDEAKCPISLSVMKEPVMLSSGVIVEKDKFYKSDGHGEVWLTTCPVTDVEIFNEAYPVHSLSCKIAEWR